MQNDIASYATEGQLMFDGQKLTNLRAVADLYPEHIQIVAHASAEVRSVADLRGKRVAIGAIGSGTEANAIQVLEAHGVSVSDLGAVERLNPSESRDYLQDRRVDAAFFTFGVGTAAIQELALVADIVFLPVDGEIRDRLIAQYPFYSPAQIPADSYRNQSATVPTVAVTATLVARDDVPDRVIEAILNGMFSNLSEFRQTHARLQSVNLEQARATLALPLHPAAERYYARTQE